MHTQLSQLQRQARQINVSIKSITVVKALAVLCVLYDQSEMYQNG